MFFIIVYTNLSIGNDFLMAALYSDGYFCAETVFNVFIVNFPFRYSFMNKLILNGISALFLYDLSLPLLPQMMDAMNILFREQQKRCMAY